LNALSLAFVGYACACVGFCVGFLVSAFFRGTRPQENLRYRAGGYTPIDRDGAINPPPRQP
jgi:hypothetical protein